MDKREFLKEYLGSCSNEDNLIKDLLSCLITKDDNKFLIEEWLENCIRSIFYEPNKTVLVLVPSKGCDNAYCITSNLFPKKDLFCKLSGISYPSVIKEAYYEKFIIDFTFEKKTLNYPSMDNFTIYEDNVASLIHPATDKRLCSYSTTVPLWPYPQRKNYFVIEISSFDYDSFLKIDKLQLWSQLFTKYKKR